MLTSKISVKVMGDFISRLSFPGKRIVFHSKKAYAALISWNIYLFTKACLHFSEENTETFSSLTSYPELRRSEFLIGGYVGARALLLSAAPQDLSY